MAVNNGPRIQLRDGTELRLADGSAAAVETLNSGDLLLGPDGRARTVMDVDHHKGTLTATRFRLWGSEQELLSLHSTGPVPLRKQTQRYDNSDTLFSHDADALRARVQALVGPLPQPDLKPDPGAQQTTTIPCDSFMQALRRGFSTLLAVERSGAAKTKFEKAVNGLTSVKVAANAVFVFFPSRRDKYRTFTWDPGFVGGHSEHPPTFFATEVEARNEAQAFASSLYMSGTETLFNLKSRFKRAIRKKKRSIRIGEDFRNFRIFWDKWSVKRGEYFVDVYDQQTKPGWHYKYAFWGDPEFVAFGPVAGPAGPSTTSASIFRIFDVVDIAESVENRYLRGEDEDGLEEWRVERHTAGIDFEDEFQPPVNPFVVGFLVGCEETRHIKQGHFLHFLQKKLTPFVLPEDDEDPNGLDRDPLQDCFPDSRFRDKDENDKPPEFAYLRKLRNIQAEQSTTEQEAVQGAVEHGATAPPALPSVAEVLDVYGLDGDVLYNQLSRLGVVGSSAEPRLPAQFLCASRQDRLQLLAGLNESCHTTVSEGRFRLHRHPGWPDAVARDIRALCLSLGMQCQHYRHGREGFFDPDDEINFVEITGDITIVPCRIAKLLDPVASRPRNLIEIVSVAHDEWSQDDDVTSFRVGGDGLFLREDYVILGGAEVQDWKEGEGQ